MSEENENNDQNHMIPDSNMSYDLDANYESTYRKENLNPERYEILTNLYGQLPDIFLKFIEDNEDLNFLRSIDINLCIKGSDVIFTDGNTRCKISAINDRFYTLIVNSDSTVIKTQKKYIKPIDNFINKLKAHQTLKLYNFIYENIEYKAFTNVLFFHAFTEYFKINEKTLYDILSNIHKARLIKELRESSGSIIEKMDLGDF